MSNKNLKYYDIIFAIVLAVLTIAFILLGFTNEKMFDWAFARHQNQLSWYIRPLFLIPFCFFAYRRSLAGIFGTMFLLITSMIWFPVPAEVNSKISDFLAMEKEYLTGNWGTSKILITVLVPVSLSVLAMALWKRSLWIGISTLIFIAVAKMLWSVVFGGESGKSVIVPAMIGLVICIVMVVIGFIRLEKKKSNKQGV
ncbi:MAG: hypothetical protein K0R34_4351 [Herbinix sp.]|nr:hypothetical protein [Herbinix sp.]